MSIDCCTYGCTGGKDCPCRPTKIAPIEHDDLGGCDVWFVGEEPEPLTVADRLAIVAILFVSIAIVAGATGFFYQLIF